ncbi:MAG TPA: helix-turn-helix transcriptional regulator [Actinocrinis sp.]|nr:helix-turn-helix transcriptional regulator [Actinocrinis sp.]
MTTADQRRELAAFLRNRRERRQPEDVGMPAGERRKTPGLRREEVAILAGLSVTWYTWLEQAREVRASRQVLGSLVGVLGLSQVETAHLYRLAGEVPPGAAPQAAGQLPSQYTMLLEQLDPNPAYLVNRRFDVLAWNRGCAALYVDLPHVPPERRNILWLMFTSPAMREMSTDWARDAAQTVALFRTQAGEGVLEPGVAKLVAAVREASPEFAELWRRRDLAAFAPAGQVLVHPKLGQVELEYVKMHSGDGDKTLVAFLAPRGSELFARLGEVVGGDGFFGGR